MPSVCGLRWCCVCDVRGEMELVVCCCYAHVRTYILQLLYSDIDHRPPRTT